MLVIENAIVVKPYVYGICTGFAFCNDHAMVMMMVITMMIIMIMMIMMMLMIIDIFV